MKKIQIDSISQDKTQYGMKITLISGKEKYIFYDTKKDNTHTKAFEQFKKFGFQIGDTVEAEVKEEERSFVNEQGKNVKYMQRTIIFFNEIENTPVLHSPTVGQNNNVSNISNLEARVKRLEDKVFAETAVVEDDEVGLDGIKVEDIPF